MAYSCYPISSANLSTAATEMTFHGNDALTSFKNEDLIDITGTFNGGTAKFDADQIIGREVNVPFLITIYNKTTQHASFASHNCSNC